MYRFLTKENQDGWEIIKAKLKEANNNATFPEEINYVGIPRETIGKEYVCNTALDIYRPNSYGQQYLTIKYNRINLATMFKGLTIHVGDFVNVQNADIINYFENSHIYLDKNCTFRTYWVDSNSRECSITANKDNILFYGKAIIKILDKRHDLSEVVTNNTINFSPKGQLWIAPNWSASDYVESDRYINDLRYESSRLGVTKSNIAKYGFDRFTYDNYDLLYDFEAGKYVSDYSDKHGELLTRILKLHHSWYAYGYKREIENGEEFPYEINVAECMILYNGKRVLDKNSEFSRPTQWCDNTIILEPIHKRYSHLYTRTISLGYSNS